ncbi:MAG: hypothetical protein J6Y57_03685 [Lachnospiraceae bacterium]|nr:hypothetical protein [Lachnospiraceae bacterium]
MLGNLMKYEWKYIWKKFLLFCGLLVLATIIGIASSREFLKLEGINNVAHAMFSMLGFLLYYALYIGATLGFTLIVAIRFYKAVYGTQGYLTHTLPVTPRQIYLAHLIVYGICMSLISVMTQLSIQLVSGTMFDGIFQATGMGGAMSYSSGAEFFGDLYGMSPFAASLMTTLCMVIGSFSSLLTIYASVVLGQYWKKHKVWGAVVNYILIQVVTAIVSVVVYLPYFIRSIMTMESGDPANLLGGGFWGITLAITIVIGIATFLIMDHGMTKRLNLE